MAKAQTEYFRFFMGVVAQETGGSWNNIKENWRGQFFELQSILEKIRNDLNSPLSNLPHDKEKVILPKTIQTNDLKLLDELKEDLAYIARSHVEVVEKIEEDLESDKKIQQEEIEQYREACINYFQGELEHLNTQRELVGKLSKLPKNSIEYATELQNTLDRDFTKWQESHGLKGENISEIKAKWQQQQKQQYEEYWIKFFHNEQTLTNNKKGPKEHAKLIKARDQLRKNYANFLQDIAIKDQQQAIDVQKEKDKALTEKGNQKEEQFHATSGSDWFVREKILTKEELDILGYEICETFKIYIGVREDTEAHLQEYSPVILENVKELINIARNSYKNNPLKGFHDLSAIGHGKINELIVNSNDPTLLPAVTIALKDHLLKLADIAPISEPILAELNTCNIRENNNVLHAAAYKGFIDVTQAIMANKPSAVNIADNIGRTSLHLAAGAGNSEIIEILCKPKDVVIINAEINSRMTPLHYAAANGKVNAIETLYKKGAHLEPKSNDGMTPLHFAAIGGHVDAIETLCKKGANVNMLSHDYSTPLHFAAKNGHDKAVNFLITAGANFTDNIIKNIKEETLVEGIIEYGKKGKTAKEVISRITEKISDLKAVSVWTLSVQEKIENTCKELVEYQEKFKKESKLAKESRASGKGLRKYVTGRLSSAIVSLGKKFERSQRMDR